MKTTSATRRLTNTRLFGTPIHFVFSISALPGDSLTDSLIVMKCLKKMRVQTPRVCMCVGGGGCTNARHIYKHAAHTHTAAAALAGKRATASEHTHTQLNIHTQQLQH